MTAPAGHVALGLSIINRAIRDAGSTNEETRSDARVWIESPTCARLVIALRDATGRDLSQDVLIERLEGTK